MGLMTSQTSDQQDLGNESTSSRGAVEISICILGRVVLRLSRRPLESLGMRVSRTILADKYGPPSLRRARDKARDKARATRDKARARAIGLDSGGGGIFGGQKWSGGPFLMGTRFFVTG